MSVQILIPDLAAAMNEQIGWCYLLSVAASGNARVLAVTPMWSDDGCLTVKVGHGTADNLAAHPDVALVFPPRSVDGMSLIVDGMATVTSTGAASIQPLTAVLHRSALSL
jgi:hypothetical protein